MSHQTVTANDDVYKSMPISLLKQYLTKSTRKPWYDSFESNQSIDGDKCNKKTDTLVTTSHKPAGEANLHVQFLYYPQTIWNYTWGQVSVSMNTGPVNEKYTGQI